MKVETSSKRRESRMPKVSVIIPVYNVEPYIETCILSVLNQSVDEFDIVVVDDESPDNSIELIQEIDDPRISIVRQKNRGLAGARNTGIRESRGEYLAFLDSDDYWHPQKLEKHIDQLEADPSIDVSFSASMFVNEHGEPLNRLQQPINKRDFSAPRIFCRNPIGNGSAPVIKRQALERIGFTTPERGWVQYFDESLRQSEDIDCWIRLSLQGKCTFGYIDEPLTFYRLNGGGLSANVDKQFDSWLKVYEKVNQIDPVFSRKYGPLAKAYQYRYLARRLIVEGDARKAVSLLKEAVYADVSFIWREPARSISTIGAALMLSILPSQLVKKIVTSTFS